MSGNSTERLLRALYENVGDGALSISYLDERKIPITRWFTKDQIPEMVAYGIECGKTLNTYLNINPRIAAMDTYHRGKSKDVYEVVTIHVDFDIKGRHTWKSGCRKARRKSLIILRSCLILRLSSSGRETESMHIGF